MQILSPSVMLSPIPGPAKIVREMEPKLIERVIDPGC